MKILYAASEAVPFCKTGGLADVAGFPASRSGGAGSRDRCDPASVPTGQRKICRPTDVPVL